MDCKSTQHVNLLKTENNENIIEIEIPFPLFQYLSAENCNIQNICRICLSVNEPILHPLFAVNEQSVLANMVMAISEVQMNPEDGLPSNICTGCHTELMNYYEFKMKCIKSDYLLKSVLKGEFIINDTSNGNNITESTTVLEKPDAILLKDEVTPYQPKQELPELDYLEDLKQSLSDEEALCIVQDTANNQREITILDRDPKTIFDRAKESKENGTRKKKDKLHCRYCSKKFQKAKSLNDHISKRHAAAVAAELAFQCGECKEAFESSTDLEIHSILHNQEDEWKCTQCQKKFKNRTALRRHIERHMSRRKFACSRCGAAFVELYALRRHARVHTGQAVEKKHKCTQCDKRFSWAGELTAHMSTHGGERGFVCECGAAFATQRLLTSHQRIHSSDKPYQCTFCDKRFRHESTRNTHLRTHTGERPYVCAQCGKAFIQHSNMALHMRTHTGERPYACTMCVRKFASSSSLKAHIRTHTGERPFTCNICGKKFARVSFKSHMRWHSGERAHACPAPSCHKRFATKYRLTEHCRQHTGEKPFECANCSVKYTRKSQLIRHMKTHEKKKAGKKGVMLMPVTVSDKNLRPDATTQADKTEYMLVNLNDPNTDQVQEIPLESEKLLYGNDNDVKTEVIVLDSNPNLVTNSVSYVNDINYTNDVNLMTMNEQEVSISAGNAIDGTTVKLYQYDQSLVQIQTEDGHLTISRITVRPTTECDPERA